LTKEQRLNLLILEEARLALEQAIRDSTSYAGEYERAKRLFDEGMLTLIEWNRIRGGYEQAKLTVRQRRNDLEQAELDILTGATHLSIVEARLSRTTTGRRMVAITVQNTSNAGQAIVLGGDRATERITTLLRLQRVIVSLREGAATVGEPYEQIIPSLALGERQTLTFRLLKDVDRVDVVLTFLERASVIPVVLTRGSSQILPTLSVTQFSQEGSLGSKVRYGLILERLAEEEQSFRLLVLNLPRPLEARFIDPRTEASLAQVRFGEAESKLTLDLEVMIPEHLDRTLVGQTIGFVVVVTETGELPAINALRVRYGETGMPQEAIDLVKGEKTTLELIPKGVGKLEVVISNRYVEIEAGREEVAMRVDVQNRGTLGVQNVKATLDLPYGWESVVEPALLKDVAAGSRTPATLRIRPPGDVSVGEYAIGVEAEGQVGNETVESVKKTITIRVGAKTSITGNVLLIGGLVVLVAAMGIISIRISRR
jgi:hypothetical protein